jgi:hypothetical protein
MTSDLWHYCPGFALKQNESILPLRGARCMSQKVPFLGSAIKKQERGTIS